MMKKPITAVQIMISTGDLKMFMKMAKINIVTVAPIEQSLKIFL